MKRTALALLAVLAGGAVAAAEIRDYQTRLELADNGAGQATVTLSLAGVKPGRLRVPVSFAAIESARAASAPAGVTLEARSAAGQALVELDVPEGAPPEFTLAFSYSVPGLLVVPKPEEGQKSTFPDGSRLVRHAIVNTQEATIARYQLRLLLPEATQVHNIREALPRPRRKEFVPRVELDRFDGRQGALLQASALRQGDRVSMELEVVGAQRSWAWALVLLPLAAGYLVAFRDLVARPTAA